MDCFYVKEGSELYDIAVAGAGVAGSYIAYRLASLGYKVAVFEEHEKIGQPVQCTGIIGAECFERFPLFEGTVLGTANSAKLFSPSGKEIRLQRDSIQAYIIDRAAFDQQLAEKARGQGAQYHLGNRVNNVVVLDDGVMLETEEQETFKAKTAVIATGFGTKIPQKLGLGSIDDIIMGAQVEVDIDGVDEIEVYFDQKLAPGFFAWVVPTSKHKALVGLFSRKNTARHLGDLLSTLFRQNKIASPEATHTYGGVPLRSLKRTYTGRVLVVGDAAGQVKPTTGGGVYYGLLCAEIAAETLNQAIATDDFSEKLFSGYENAWRRKLGRELRVDRFARQVYKRLTNRQIDLIFNTIESTGVHESLLRSPELSFDWHGDAILKGLKYVGPWRRLFAFGRQDVQRVSQTG